VRRRAFPSASCAIAAALALAACAGNSGSTSLPIHPSAHHRSGSTPIQHVVVLIQENRTFNNLFAGFPGATSTKTGEELVQQGSTYVEEPIKLKEVELTDHGNVTHLYKAFTTACNLQGSTCAMDGFDLIAYINGGKPEGKAPYQYVNPKDTKPYWAIAHQWGLANAMFQTQGSDSFTAHQDLIRGDSCIASCQSPSASTESLIDPPTTSAVWGCDSAPGAKTFLINIYGQESASPSGPFPCSNDFPNYGSNGYETLRDLLDAKYVSWKYYTPVWKSNTPSALWSAFDMIAPVRYGPEWTDGHIASPETTIFSDLTSGTLPAMSWVIPDANNSDHPGYKGKDLGPSWVASVVNAIGNSSYWDSTAVIVVWDDWGGFYDPVPPPSRDWQGGPGFRVPMLVISPYVQLGSGKQGGYISNTTYEFGSILRFVEDTFNLGRLGTTDGTSTSMADMFNFSQSPRPFQTIPSTYKKRYFVHQKPSGLPVDTE
jgi:phospholipase C